MKFMRKIKGACLALRLRLHGQQVGSGLLCESWNPFACSLSGKRKISLGNNVSIGRNMMFWVKRGAELTIGHDCVFTGDAYVRASQSITIGDHTAMAEFSSIRDANHGMEGGAEIFSQESSRAPVTIGRDVWIGAGCRILMGAQVPDGCVIGANSVVLGKSRLESGGIYAGAPVKFIRTRFPRGGDVPFSREVE